MLQKFRKDHHYGQYELYHRTQKRTTEHRKGQHLLNEERYEIEVRLKDGWSIYKIAKYLGRAYNTIKDEVERGTVTLYNGKIKRYKADEGKSVYLENRKHSTRRYRIFETAPFLEYVVKRNIRICLT